MSSKSYKWKLRPQKLNGGTVVTALSILDRDGETWRPPTETEIVDMLGHDEMPYAGTMSCPWAAVGVLVKRGMDDALEDDKLLGFPTREDL